MLSGRPLDEPHLLEHVVLWLALLHLRSVHSVPLSLSPCSPHLENEGNRYVHNVPSTSNTIPSSPTASEEVCFAAPRGANLRGRAGGLKDDILAARHKRSLLFLGPDTVDARDLKNRKRNFVKQGCM